MIRNRCLYFLPIIFIYLILHCSGTSRNQSVLTQRIIKQDYRNIITVYGILEAIHTHNIACEGIRTDATVAYLKPEGTYVEAGDTVCILEATEIENNYNEALRNLENARAEYNKTIADLNLQTLILESQMSTIDAQTQIAQLDSSRIQFASDSQKKRLNLQMRKADIEKDKISQKLNFLQRINESELKKMKAKIRQEENRVSMEKEKMDRLILKCDVAGMLIYDRLWTSGVKVREGDIVWGNMPIAQIPDLSKMQVKITVNDTKYKQIEIGQQVQMRVDAFPEVQLTGEIITKPPVGKPVQRGSRIKEFELYSSIDTLRTQLDPGLSVTCRVTVEVVEDTLVIPLCAVFDQDSIKVVYVENGNEFKSQEIKIAQNNASYAIVSDGLAENQIIALAKPPDASIIYDEE